MKYHQVHTWTLFELVRAFSDLAFVYFLLCVSAILLIPSKILNVIGLYLPCPCSGFYGFQNSHICLHNLLVDWPRRKVYLVLDSVKSRFPFDLILVDDQMSNSDRNLLTDNYHENPIPHLQSGAFGTTFFGPKLQNLVDKDCEYDGKGKRIMYQRSRSRIRRRRRLSNNYLQTNLPDILYFPYEGNEAREEKESWALGERADFNPDDINESNHIDLGERSRHGFESSGSVGNDDYVDKVSSSIKHSASNGQESGIIKNEESSIRLLEQALEEEKAARASLCVELEKERAASATAADEAIAMILRLQNDKAAIEMEARQYQRIIEEKFAYDEEEMNILREILIRREIDNHILEREIESYRKMGCLERELSERKWGYILDEFMQQSLNTNGDLLAFQQIENTNSLSKKTKVKGSTSYGELQEDLENKGEEDSGEQSSLPDMEMDVQDIHVIDEKLHIEGKKEELHQMIPEFCYKPLEHLMP